MATSIFTMSKKVENELNIEISHGKYSIVNDMPITCMRCIPNSKTEDFLIGSSAGRVDLVGIQNGNKVKLIKARKKLLLASRTR